MEAVQGKGSDVQSGEVGGVFNGGSFSSFSGAGGIRGPVVRSQAS